MSSPKQVIIIRKDLNMRKGKIAAQASHASMKILLDLLESKSVIESGKIDRSKTELSLVYDNDSPLGQWLSGKFTKICLSVESEEELLDIYNKACSANILSALIKDAGLTEFNGVPTLTCCAIGPDFPDKIDIITSHLKLL